MHTALLQRLARYLPCLEWARQYDRDAAARPSLPAASRSYWRAHSRHGR